MPAPSSAGVLGMARTTSACAPSHCCSRAVGMPAAMEITSWPGARRADSSLQTLAITCGLTASSQLPASSRALAMLSATVMPYCWCRLSRSAACGSMTSMAAGAVPEWIKPAIRLRAMLPPPMKLTSREGDITGSLWVLMTQAEAGLAGRAPNSALPTRTRVAPALTAWGKSALIPRERVSTCGYRVCSAR